MFDVESVRLGLAVRPGEVPANVFDFDTGTRLIVSRERSPGGEVFTHYSASVWPGTPDWRALRGVTGACGLPGFLRFYGEKIRELVPGERPALIGITGGGIPHWRSAP